ncbi:MAG: hypothetical protein JNL11_14515 [Bdellovibrionaceae bacterium]|nr:hypothetical protein [Pseudobdellovibrionaceae bacterium]
MKHLFFILFAVLVVCFLHETAWAQASENKNDPPIAKWLLSDTETKLTFDDGREASLILQVKKKVKHETKAIIIENSCFPELLPQNCKWNYEFGAYTLSFVWSKHPDASKLKTVLKVERYQRKERLSLDFTDADINGIEKPMGGVTKKAPVLECDNDNWTSNLPKTATKNILVPAWAAEFNSENRITGKNENLSVFQSDNLELKPIGKNKWEAMAPEGTHEFTRLIPMVDPNTAYYQKDQNQCSLQFRIEKSLVGVITAAGSQPVEQTYSYPLGRGISKSIRSNPLFFYLNTITREQAKNNQNKIGVE